jgi:hypothetical protein
MNDKLRGGPPASDRVLERARRMMHGDILTGRPDPEGLLTLARRVFPGEDIGDSRFLPWLYDRNPGGRALEFTASSAGLVSGHIAVLPRRYKIGGGTMAGSVVVNAITHPDFRGRGIFMVLHEDAFRSPGAQRIAFSFGFANENSERGCFRHLGYRELVRLPLWILPLNLPGILASQPSKRSVSWRAAARAAQPLARLWRFLRQPRRSSAVTVERIADFGPEFDDLWRAVSNTADNILVRDRAFLNWRFVEPPTRRYDILAARSGGRLTGYLAGRITPVEGMRWGIIADLLSEKTKEGRAAAASLVAAYSRQVLKEGADIVAGLMLRHVPPALGLRRNGYIVCPPSLLPREFPALVRWYAHEPAPPGFFDPRSWFLTLADYDAV